MELKQRRAICTIYELEKVASGAERVLVWYTFGDVRQVLRQSKPNLWSQPC